MNPDPATEPHRLSLSTLPAALVNTENATSFLGHHISATCELRAGVVKAPGPHSVPSVAKSLDEIEHGSR